MYHDEWQFIKRCQYGFICLPKWQLWHSNLSCSCISSAFSVGIIFPLCSGYKWKAPVQSQGMYKLQSLHRHLFRATAWDLIQWHRTYSVKLIANTLFWEPVNAVKCRPYLSLMRDNIRQKVFKPSEREQKQCAVLFVQSPGAKRKQKNPKR